MDILPGQTAAANQAKRPPAPPPVSPTGEALSRAMRILFALGILGTTIWFVYDRFFVVSTQTAVLSGRMITLRASIDGRIDMPLHFPGDQLSEGAVFATVVNDRANAYALGQLWANIATVEAELASLEHRAGGTSALLRDAVNSAEAFRKTRVDQIAARLAEAESLLRVADARLREATTAATRGQSLVRHGFTTQAAMEVLRRDLDVARETQRALAERRESLLVEQAGAIAGIFATDNATDRSISQQTMDRLTLTLVEVNAMIAERRTRLPALQRGADREEQRLLLQQEGPIRVPAPGVIVRILAYHGEVVRAGQEIARIAACGEPILTAELDDRSMRRVLVGQKAEFRPVGSPQILEGEVVQIVPVSLTPGEARTRPQALLRLASQANACETGRMGEVRFLP